MEVASKNSLVNVIGKEEAFCFRLYYYKPRGITRPQLFVELIEEINLVP